MNEIGVYIDRKGASIPPEFKLTHDRKAALVKVKVKYPFGMLEECYRAGVMVFAKKMECVGETQIF